MTSSLPLSPRMKHSKSSWMEKVTLHRQINKYRSTKSPTIPITANQYNKSHTIVTPPATSHKTKNNKNNKLAKAHPNVNRHKTQKLNT